MGLVKFVDHLIDVLDVERESKEEFREELISILKEDLRKERELALDFAQQVDHLPYPHLREEGAALLNDFKRYGEQISGLIRELGGNSDEEPFDYQPEASDDFESVLKKDTYIAEELSEHANWAEDNGYRHVARVLRDIRDAHRHNQERIERIIMRMDGMV